MLRELPPVRQHDLVSAHVEQTFRVKVCQPPVRRSSRTALPVVYVTDGNITFDLFRGIWAMFHLSEQEAPEFILVSIGYPSEFPTAGYSLRGRDLTFEGFPDFTTGVPVRWTGVLEAEPNQKRYGGAREFLQFIERELVPFIDANYPSNPRERIYFGHSAGATFGLFALSTRSELFRDYVISSPALSYHGTSACGESYEHYDFMFDRMRQFANSGRSCAGRSLYLSVGTREETEPGLRNWRMTSSVSRFTSMLTKLPIPGLRVFAESLEGESHTTAWPIAFMHGIQCMFGTRNVARLV